MWQANVNSSSKLHFYSIIKTHFAKEHYLDSIKNYKDRTNLTRLRTSAHRLEIETGRYKNVPRHERSCAWCKVVFSNSVIEDEQHLLNSCDMYAKSRVKLVQKLTSLTSSIEYNGPITNATNFLQIIGQNTKSANEPTPDNQALLARIISRYITNCFNTRSKFLDSINNANQTKSTT